MNVAGINFKTIVYLNSPHKSPEITHYSHLPRYMTGINVTGITLAISTNHRLFFLANILSIPAMVLCVSVICLPVMSIFETEIHQLGNSSYTPTPTINPPILCFHFDIISKKQCLSVKCLN